MQLEATAKDRNNDITSETVSIDTSDSRNMAFIHFPIVVITIPSNTDQRAMTLLAD